ncbi:oxidoreductase [Dictyobacter sp. S3.2.2.5]|uniref:Oxidoreductase n=1 Tax=Dictyobacter halimunensis TaxID=3026934 RepID=A0ABQ6FND7_9CHLR|nr:oxidoreductase [Dictyobacter sp. S3.2.2.5]
MVHVAKIGHAAFHTTNLDRLLAYYTDILGLTLTARGSDGTAYLSCGIDHHSVILTPATENRLHHVAFQLDQSVSLSDAARQLHEAGIESELMSDAQPGIPELLQISDPDSNLIQLYANTEHVSSGFGGTGIVPVKLGHVAMYVSDVKKVVAFYQQALGFRVSDWLEDFFVFMRCTIDHHTMNFLQSKRKNEMFHVAFELRDWAQVQSACDWLNKHHLPLAWGPGRHGIGHNIFTYHYDPDHNLVELFTEIDILSNEDVGYFEPRPWHEDFPQEPKVWKDSPEAVNKWGVLPPAGLMG